MLTSHNCGLLSLIFRLMKVPRRSLCPHIIPQGIIPQPCVFIFALSVIAFLIPAPSTGPALETLVSQVDCTSDYALQVYVL